MRICVSDEEGSFKAIEVPSSIELENLAPLIELELQIPASRQQLYCNGIQLTQPKQTLESYNIVQDDVILVRTSPQQSNGRSMGSSSSSTPMTAAEQTRQRILANPEAQRQLIMQNPAIAGALASSVQFERIYNEMERQRIAYEQNQAQALHNLETADSFDVEAQKKIAEEIRKANVAQNMERAIEYHPESFGRVIMLYINCEVNGHPVKAFVDSGAQATIMSPECAEMCHVMHLLDERFSGVAHGVGTAKILGRIHSTQIKVGNLFLPCSLTVMEGKGVDLLFGLDMLKRHLACIDLGKNVMRISQVEVPFLSEHELPDKARLEVSGLPKQDSSDSQPSASGLNSNAGIPQTSGTLVAPPPEPNLATASLPASTSVASPYPEAVVQGLMDLGATRDQALNALEACGGNADMAAELIL